MKHPDHEQSQTVVALRFFAAFAALVCLGLVGSSSAIAAYEQVGTFAGTPGVLKKGIDPSEWPEEVQLGGVGGMAVNYTGAGGVPAGTVYAVRSSNIADTRTLVSRYNPDGTFSERWTFEGTPEPTERCGPEGDPAHPTCGSEPQTDANDVDVDVDQSTGNVYVYNNPGGPFSMGRNEIRVYTPDGSELIAEFGEAAPNGETITESPEKLHASGTSHAGAIAVDGLGVVYVYDEDTANHNRLMTFEPQSPGDYQHYVYAGQGHDFGTVAGFGRQPQYPVVDAAGNVYAASREGHFVKLDPSTPSAPPLCEFDFAKGGVTAIAVDPLSGEVFFNSQSDKGAIHVLGAECQAGKFVEVGQIKFSPRRLYLGAMAFDPQREYEVGRSTGVLYGGAPTGEGGKTEKDGEGNTLGEVSMGYIFSRPAAIPPTVESVSFAHVTETTAELNTRINPRGSVARYVFQYETEAQYEENEASDRFAGALESPVGGALVGEGTEGVSVSTALLGLSPDTSYRFQVVATSHCSAEEPEEVCEAAGEALALRTFPTEAPGLPDHRAYELVSPAEKHGGQVLPADPSFGTCTSSGNCKPSTQYVHFPMQSSPDGESIAYEGTAFDSEHASLTENEYLAQRDPKTGWHTANPTPTAMRAKGGGYQAFSAALGAAVLGQDGVASTLAPEAPVGYQNLYVQSSDSPSIPTPLLSEGQSFHRSGSEFHIKYAGASADLSRVFFEANDALTDQTAFAPEAVDGGKTKFNLYEWHEGQLALVNVLPDNASTQPGASIGVASTHAISADGARVFWSDEAGRLYLRIGGSETQLLSGSQRSAPDPIGLQPATYLTASTDGSRALFASSQELTDDANTGSIQQQIVLKATAGTFTLTFNGQTTSPLAFNSSAAQVQAALEGLSSIGAGNVTVISTQGGYTIAFAGSLLASEELITVNGSSLTGTFSLKVTRPNKDLYEWHEGTLTDLTAGQGKGGFEGIAGQSEDLSRIYFVDTAVLDETPNAQGEEAKAGKFNLYSWIEGEGTRFVATLLAEDNHGGFGGESFTGADWNLPYARTAEASPDGHWLTFLSAAPLTGYNNTGPSCKLVDHGPPPVYGPGPCSEAFIYDSATQTLVCASCDPSGERPLDFTVLRRIYVNGAANLPQPRYLTNEGRLYFDSRDSLVPADTNHGVEDVYQYEPSGVGSCGRDEGCVSLISAGTGTVDSNFLTMDPSGKNVFFTTRDQLTLKDKDQLIDLYDAREGGGITSETETGRVECQGEACQQPVSPPNDPTPGSSTFQGAGNVNEAKAKKHVKKHAKKKHAPKRATKRNHGGAK